MFRGQGDVLRFFSSNRLRPGVTIADESQPRYFSLELWQPLSQAAAERRITTGSERVVVAACKKDAVSLTELRSGSRRGQLPAVRVKIAVGW